MRNRAIAALSAALLFAAALEGCSSVKPAGSSRLSQSQPTVSPAITPTSGATPSTAPTSTSGKGGSGAGGNSGAGSGPTPTYSASAKSYAQNTVNAWAKKSPLLADYTSAGGAVAFANLATVNVDWHYHACGPDGTLTACVFFNDDGDQLTVDVDPALLGKPRAATNAVLLRTDYPSTADSMVGELLNAWAADNKYRVAKLSSSSTANALFSISGGAPSGFTLSDDATTNPGYTIVTVHVLSGGGSDITLRVTNSKLGSAHAVYYGVF